MEGRDASNGIIQEGNKKNLSILTASLTRSVSNQLNLDILNTLRVNCLEISVGGIGREWGGGMDIWVIVPNDKSRQSVSKSISQWVR